MDQTLFTVLFLFTTAWVGPFWMLMLIAPDHERTHKWMQPPWFFVGPLVVWFIVILSDPKGLMELVTNSSSDGMLDGLVTLLGTPEGTLSAWAHMVAGDILVTRWIWKRTLEHDTDLWIARLCIFLGVMLMPLGLALSLFLVKEKNQSALGTGV